MGNSADPKQPLQQMSSKNPPLFARKLQVPREAVFEWCKKSKEIMVVETSNKILERCPGSRPDTTLKSKRRCMFI